MKPRTKHRKSYFLKKYFLKWKKLGHLASRDSICFILLLKEGRRRLCLNHVKPSRTPQTKLRGLVNLAFSRQTCFFKCEHLFIDKPMVITDPSVARARLLGLGRNYILANSPACSTKILLNLCNAKIELANWEGLCWQCVLMGERPHIICLRPLTHFNMRESHVSLKCHPSGAHGLLHPSLCPTQLRTVSVSLSPCHLLRGWGEEMGYISD